MASALVLFHANCRDGFTAAWVARSALGSDTECIAVSHGQPPPDVSGRDVYILDFSYPREVLERMYAEAGALVVLDHHKTSEADLEGLSYCTFDMNRSGAGLAWDSFFSAGTRPKIVRYVEDRDLWRFALPESKAINAWLGVLAFDFSIWAGASHRLETQFDDCVDDGRAVIAKIDQYVAETRKFARYATVAGSKVPVVNATPSDNSELLHALAEGQAFAVSWFQRADGKYQYSLRSGETGRDVAEIAQSFGGGGHLHAAGFTSDRQLF